MRRAWAVGIGVQREEAPVRRVRNSDSAREGEGARRWLKRVRIGAWVGGMRRTRRPVRKRRISLCIPIQGEASDFLCNKEERAWLHVEGILVDLHEMGGRSST